MWAKNNYGQDNLLANLPEFPHANDFGNLSKLQSLDGKMSPFWVNLYSVALED